MLTAIDASRFDRLYAGDKCVNETPLAAGWGGSTKPNGRILYMRGGGESDVASPHPLG